VASNGSKLIGISCYLEPASFGVWHTVAALIPRSYVNGVVVAGGTPVLLPPGGSWDVGLVSRLDGLVLAGGADIDPARYGQTPLETTGEPRQPRDSVEFELFEAARQVGLPVLGVCRGMQVINIALGGNLNQHVPDLVGNSGHRPEPGVFGVVDVKVAAGSRLAGILGEELFVSCHHHQGVDRLGAGLVPVAWSDDGLVEAIELPGEQFLVGVQWHPEEYTAVQGPDHRLFEALVAAT
jgi:putative glutamine amidotransferase